MVRFSVLIAAVVACAAAPACGQAAGDCSGGPNCSNGGRPVHWTNLKATAAARAFDFRPMIQGRMTDVRCRIIARYPAHEATALCRGVFASPSKRAGPFVARFALSGIGVMNPDCSVHWKTSPYCNRKGHVITDASR
jgi:hypothetical protein